jgi:hypothetical protein
MLHGRLQESSNHASLPFDEKIAIGGECNAISRRKFLQRRYIYSTGPAVLEGLVRARQTTAIKWELAKEVELRFRKNRNITYLLAEDLESITFDAVELLPRDNVDIC